jgi:hypothetical protein
MAALVTLAIAVGTQVVPVVAAGTDTPRSVDGPGVLARWPLPAPPVDAQPWAPATTGRSLLDDFEGTPWPRADRWVQVLDLTGPAAGDYAWAPRGCHPAGGSRALWAIGGGLDGARLACGASYPGEAAASALLYLDLSAQRDAARLGLTFDIWPDAAPNEGLFINFVAFDAAGTPLERRTVYSATGRGRTWARGIRLDLTDLRDRRDPAWQTDLRGQLAYLEFLFVSMPGQPTGEGIHLDNLYVESEDAVVATPTPGGNQTVGCAVGDDCGTLTVRAFVDGRCDGRFQPGLDSPLRGARVDVTAGAMALGTTTSKSGNAFFRVPLQAPIDVGLTVPDGYAACANSAASVRLTAADFRPFGRKHLDFRLTRRR